MIKNFEEFLNESGIDVLELTSMIDAITTTPIKQLDNAVIEHKHINYRDRDLTNDILKNILKPFSKKVLNVDERGVKYEISMIGAEDSHYTISGNFVYLGYIPKEDIFVCAWNMVDRDMNCAFVKLDQSFKPIHIPKLFKTFGHFYDSSGYMSLKKEFKVVDIVKIK